MSNMNNMYYFPNNQADLNASQLNKNSQIYQPNSGGYDMQMMNNMGHGNANDWASANTRKLDRNSTVFIPVKSGGNQAQQVNYQNPSMTAQPKRTTAPPMGNNPQMAMGKNTGPMGQDQWGKVQPNPGPRVPAYQDPGMMMMGDPTLGGSGIDPKLLVKNSAELEKVCQYIQNLKDPTKKYDYFKELNNQRDNIPQLAPILWFSTGTVAILLQEIINIYPNLSPPTLTQAHSERICNVLGLFQCIALHSQTKPLFIQANLHLYLYPLINKIIKQRPFEHLRVTSLGVIGALVKGDDPETISYLINTELIVLCLRIMKKGNELSRTVATFIVQKILMDDTGLTYVCQTEERLFALAQILKDIIEDIAKDPRSDKDGQRLLRHIMRCLLRLSENPKANQCLVEYIPDCIRNPNNNVIKDEQVRKWYIHLFKNLRLLPA